jgi:hypothetical protein
MSRGALFSEIPPRNIVNEVLQSLKFESIDDTRVFILKDLMPTAFKSSLQLIESYYIPCKAKKYLYNEMTPVRILTVVRQLLRSQNYTLRAQEKTTNGIRGMHYQIQSCTDIAESNILKFE